MKNNRPHRVHTQLFILLSLALAITASLGRFYRGRAATHASEMNRVGNRVFTSTDVQPSSPPRTSRASLSTLLFEPVQTQAGINGEFVGRAQDVTVWVKTGGAVIAYGRRAQSRGKTVTTNQLAVMKMRFLGADARARIVPTRPTAATRNELIGNEPSLWRTDISLYAGVRYENIYPGIDMEFHGESNSLEYDFIVAPGADTHQIRLSFDSVRHIRMNADGDLVLKSDDGEIRHRKPTVYQEIGNEKRLIDGRYTVMRGVVRFEIGNYDRSQPLIIDPVVFSTYMGGSNFDAAHGVAVDSAGNSYVVGDTVSSNFPIQNPFQSQLNANLDVFVSKFNTAGNLIYSTYIGGDDRDEGHAIAVDSGGQAVITGFTRSLVFPTTSNAFQRVGQNNAFVTKLNATGNALIYSSYLSANGQAGNGDSGTAIALDPAANIYVCGTTGSTNFPTTPGTFQSTNPGGSSGFVVKINPSLIGITSLVYSTYLGGSGADFPDGIASDAAGNAIVTGSTLSNNFPVTPLGRPFVTGGIYTDGFVTKINAAGSGLIYSTNLGGGLNDDPSGVALDSTGNAYVVGTTQSSTVAGFPATPGAFKTNYQNGSQDVNDAFVAKLDATGGIVYCSYLGGIDTDRGNGIAVDLTGNAVVIGSTLSTNFPITPGAISQTGTGFLTEFNSSGSGLLYSTLINGGSGNLTVDGVAIDSNGGFAVAGSTTSSDFPVSQAFQPVYGGGQDAFVTRIVVAKMNPYDIAFVGNDREIYSVSSNGAGQVKLTNNGVLVDEDPSWSPDGTKILFITQRDVTGQELYVMDADGSNQRALTSTNNIPEQEARWSPDGQKIAYVRADGCCNSEIYVMNSDGSNQTRLTNNQSTDQYPIWSRDGTKIYFISDGSGSSQIFVMNADGSNQTQLTSLGSNAYNPYGYSLSPDGTKMAFTSDRDGVTVGQQIYVMNSDGSNQTRISNDFSSGNLYPDWSPDGTKIAFARIAIINGFPSGGDIYIMNADGSGQRRLTNNGSATFAYLYPIWSPNGARVAFRLRQYDLQGTWGDIFVINADGSSQIKLTNFGPPINNASNPVFAAPVWSGRYR